MAVVIDDRLLLDVLARKAPAPVSAEAAGGGVFTTSGWYYRLGRAAFAGSGSGALSGRLMAFNAEVRDRVMAALQELPDDVGPLHARVVVPVMFALRVRRQLNLQSAEALAVALLVGGRLSVTTDAPLLRSGAHDLGVAYEVLA